MRIKVNGYLLSFAGPITDHVVRLPIRRDHHAEQILRGLVHSGIEVTIKETQIEVEASADDLRERGEAKLQTDGIYRQLPALIGQEIDGGGNAHGK